MVQRTENAKNVGGEVISDLKKHGQVSHHVMAEIHELHKADSKTAGKWGRDLATINSELKGFPALHIWDGSSENHNQHPGIDHSTSKNWEGRHTIAGRTYTVKNGVVTDINEGDRHWILQKSGAYTANDHNGLHTANFRVHLDKNGNEIMTAANGDRIVRESDGSSYSTDSLGRTTHIQSAGTKFDEHHKLTAGESKDITYGKKGVISTIVDERLNSKGQLVKNVWARDNLGSYECAQGDAHSLGRNVSIAGGTISAADGNTTRVMYSSGVTSEKDDFGRRLIHYPNGDTINIDGTRGATLIDRKGKIVEYGDDHFHVHANGDVELDGSGDGKNIYSLDGSYRHYDQNNSRLGYMRTANGTQMNFDGWNENGTKPADIWITPPGATKPLHYHESGSTWSCDDNATQPLFNVLVKDGHLSYRVGYGAYASTYSYAVPAQDVNS